MEELLENLLYSATFLEINAWLLHGAKDPSDAVLRVHFRAEMRLMHRYGNEVYQERLNQIRMRRFLKKC